MSDGDLLQAYDDAVGDSDDHLAGLRAVERAARAAAFRDAADVCESMARDTASAPGYAYSLRECGRFDGARLCADALRAWCQRHHLAYDREHHALTRYATRRAAARTADLFEGREA